MAPDFSRNFVKLPRPVIEALVSRPPKLQVYIECLRRARYSKKLAHDREGTLLEVGQAWVGREDLARTCRMKVGPVRTALRFLERAGFLAIESTKRGTVVTVCGYDEIAEALWDDSPPSRPALDQHKTRKTPRARQPGATTKNGDDKISDGENEHGAFSHSQSAQAADARTHSAVHVPKARSTAMDTREAEKTFEWFFAEARGVAYKWKPFERVAINTCVRRHGLDEVIGRMSRMCGDRLALGDLELCVRTLVKHFDRFELREGDYFWRGAPAINASPDDVCG